MSTITAPAEVPMITIRADFQERDEERDPVLEATQDQIDRSRASTIPAPPEDT